MDKYIIELLKTHTRVIIPDFGAFIVKVTEAPEGGESKRTISFNDFLKFNDGVLINHLIKTENINKTEALTKIKEYIKSIEQEFRKGNSYKIGDLGELSKDSRGGINFASSVEKKEKPEVKKVEKKIAKKVETKQPEKKELKATKKEVQKKPELKKEETKKEPVIKKEPIAKPVQKVEKKTVVAQKKQVQKATKKKSVIVPIAIIVVLVAAIIWALFYFNVIENINKKYFAKAEKKIVKVEKPKSQKTIKTIIDTTRQEDTAKTSKEVNAVEVKTKMTKTVNPVAKKQAEKVHKTNARKYYVVAGSFKIEANAKDFINKLTSKGFTPEYIGQRKGFYTVCYSSFDSEREAYNEAQKLKKQQVSCWVLHY